MLKKNTITIITTIILMIFSFIILFSQDSIVTKLSQKEILKKVIEDIDRAPDFTLESIYDSTYTLRNMEGKVVLVNFWATWCGPCRMEIPEFNELYEKYNQKGLEIIGISISDTKKQLENFVKSFDVDYPLLYGSTKEMNRIMREYGGVYAVPSSFLIGKKGSIIWSFPGAILKSYDPQTFATLLYRIEKELKTQ